MIIPSIDIMDGCAVQLVEGREKVVDAGDPRPIAESFGLIGEVAVIDLDAALGRGDNRALIRELVRLAPCRVGGGVRTVEAAREWLDAGARKVILGTAAEPNVLCDLPRDRVIAALDARNNNVLVEGWTKATGQSVETRIDELREYVCGFLVTFVECEGRMTGLPTERIKHLADRAAPARLTVAGGVQDPSDIATADQYGADAQIGMALYTGMFDVAAGFCAPLRSDRPDGLWPTVVVDPHGTTLGLVYSNLESIRESIQTRSGVYFSRSRSGLWRKGESSGNTQELLAIDVDCDRDALRFTVRQRGNGFCHSGSYSCFGNDTGIAALERTLQARTISATAGSYTQRLLTDDGLLRCKLMEEAAELDDARTVDEAAHEAADMLYFTLVAAVKRGASLEHIERELHRRSLQVSRRHGEAKPQRRGMLP